MIRPIPLDQIQPDPDQHRQHFDEGKLQELAESIKRHGLIEPVVVRPLGKKGGKPRYELIAGERRYRASRLAGLTDIPAVVRKGVDEKQAFEMGVIENVQRENVNAMEEAFAYKRLMEDNEGWGAAEVGKAVGKSWNYVDTRVALCELHPNLQSLVRTGNLTVGQAYEVVRAGRTLSERQGESPYETQFAILRAINGGAKVSDVCRAITLQRAVESQVEMFAPEEVERVSAEALKAKATMEEKVAKLERLCADTWDEKACSLTVSAFSGNLQSVIDRLELIERHLSRMRRDLQAEKTRRELEGLREQRKANAPVTSPAPKPATVPAELAGLAREAWDAADYEEFEGRFQRRTYEEDMDETASSVDLLRRWDFANLREFYQWARQEPVGDCAAVH